MCVICRERENRHVPCLSATCARNAQKFKGQSRIGAFASLRGYLEKGETEEDADLFGKA